MAFPQSVFECEPVRAGDRERQAVDPPRLVWPAVLPQPGAGERLDAVDLLAVDGAQRSAVALRAAGLDLAEDDGVRGPRDQVQLAPPVPPVAGEDLHPVPLEVRRREPLPEPAELVRAELAEVRSGGGSRRGPAVRAPRRRGRRG
jgi:hypothetical protein